MVTLSDNVVTRSRYFNSLSNQGLVEGTPEAPILTELAGHYLHPLDENVDASFWQGDGGDQVEYEVIRELTRRLAEGEFVSDSFKIAWYGAQTFFDYVPQNEIDGVLADRSKLLFLFRINSNGWEIARYFRLNAEDRQAFETLHSRGRPLIDYRYVPGPLMRGLVCALMHPDKNVVVLIEEINRGNAAAILGDVLQLLDRDETGSSRYEIEATLEQRAFFASLQLGRDTIRLPPNLYLWATMNSADQGVFPLDTAFRRRWNYIYKGYTEPCAYPPASAVVRYGRQHYGWDAFRGAINDFLISVGIHEDKLIGPYFLTQPQLSDPNVMLEKLFLYLWDDVLRFRQESLFTEKSFSAVSTIWANGNGAP